MKKLLYILVGFTTCIWASEDHAKIINCPLTIVCDYQKGTCDVSKDWYLSDISNGEPFPAKQPINITSINAYKMGETYSFQCNYQYGEVSFIALNQVTRNIIGNNWILSGFGNRKASCSDIYYPEECAAENRIQF